MSEADAQRQRQHQARRLARQHSPTLRWAGGEPLPAENVSLDCGWGRLIFAHTFRDHRPLLGELREEASGKRDIAFYLRDPHVLLSLAPQELFLDPSHTYRLWLSHHQPRRRRPGKVVVRRLRSRRDAVGIARLYKQLRMAPIAPDFIHERRKDRRFLWLVAEEVDTGQIVGAITGIDHAEVFDDPESGSSFWALSVDPRCTHPGVGEMLVTQVVESLHTRGRAYVDLSVLHTNKGAIALYDKLGFQRVPAFCVKRKNSFNNPLFTGPTPVAKLNPYATIIVDEALKRGIQVKVLDAAAGYFRLRLGGRSVICRESLTELTSAIAMSRCDHKRLTASLLADSGLSVPAQQLAGDEQADRDFLDRYQQLVVKPARAEQGDGISMDVTTLEELSTAIDKAREVDSEVLLEACAQGDDLRIVVINYQAVAAAIRRPARIRGDGRSSIRELIEKRSRRRQAATDGESRIPLDTETERCVQRAGYAMSDVLPEGELLQVRRTANLHTGGTLHDVTDQLHPALAAAAEKAARVLNIPVVGMDLIVPDVAGPDYVIIEANERPGLANHEPQPTAQRFIDFLFPETLHAPQEPAE